MKIEYFDSNESFGMSGPWLGKLRIDNKELINRYLDSNFVATENKFVFAFNQFYPINVESKFLFGIFRFTSEKRKFRIVLFKNDKKKWFVSKKSWPSLFLTRINFEKVYFTQAFHDEDRKMFPENSLYIRNQNFIQIEERNILMNPESAKEL